jgi:hypothetical protein
MLGPVLHEAGLFTLAIEKLLSAVLTESVICTVKFEVVPQDETIPETNPVEFIVSPEGRDPKTTE